MHAWLLSIIVLAASPDSPQLFFDGVATAIELATGGDYDLAAELVALAARESRFNPYAVGSDAYGKSYGLFQIHESNLREPWMRDATNLGIGFRIASAFQPVTAAQIAADMVRESHRVCSRRPPADRLGWYASGGPTCDVPEGLAASRNRTALAAWLLRERPRKWEAWRGATDGWDRKHAPRGPIVIRR